MDFKNVSVIMRRMSTKVNKVRKLYDLSEAEAELLMIMAERIYTLGWGAELTLKVMKALTSTWKMIAEDLEDLNKELLK